MATVPGPTSAQQRAEMMRQAWLYASGYGSSAISHVWAFFSAYPPLAQGLYYLLIGLWPLVSMRSYQRLTGHQGDLWVVEVVGVLLLAIGCTLCVAAYRKQGSPEVLVLAFGSAVGLVGVDIHLFVRGLSIVYLFDAALQVGLVVFWAYGWKQARAAQAQTAAIVAMAQSPPVAQPAAPAAPMMYVPAQPAAPVAAPPAH